jgi:general secretion pathway protein B
MSLILEALKKAERQHKLGEVPGIKADVVDARPVALRGLGWVMLLLFAGVMLGLGLYLGGFQLTLTEDAVEANASLPERAEPTPFVATMPSETPPALEAPPAALVEAPPPKPVSPPPSKEKPARPLNDMPSGFAAHLPSLNIDIHSYDKNPAKRYVLINMEKYHEGDYLGEGPQLIEILPSGVVLEYLGERFIMPIGNL